MRRWKSKHGWWLVGVTGALCLAAPLAIGGTTGHDDDIVKPVPPNLYVGPGQHYDMTSNKTYNNVTVASGGTLDTNGYTLTVENTLSNYGRITDDSSGGNGGSGGSGGREGRACPHEAPRVGGNGSSGGYGSAGAGDGGDGGGGGGGGGAVWTPCINCMPEGCLWGGTGGNGGRGGDGGGDVLIYTYKLDNHGTIEADGDDGQNGSGGGDGDYRDHYCNLQWQDGASGAGGGGGGGDGGDGGTVTIYYDILLSLNSSGIHAYGGDGGDGGAAGDLYCDWLDFPARWCQ